MISTYNVTVDTNINYDMFRYGTLYNYIISDSFTTVNITFVVSSELPISTFYDVLEEVNSKIDFTIDEINYVMYNKSLEASKWVQEFVDNKAREYRYDNMMSARSWAGYVNDFQMEAISLAEWCSQCRIKASQIEQDTINGNIDFPNKNLLLSMMPIYVHP